MSKISETKKLFDAATGKTEWVIIKLENLPDDCPVLAVSQFVNKDFAAFHLIDNVLIPKSAVDVIKIDIESGKPTTI